MSTVREQILARVAAALTGSTPAGTNVFRAREVSITRAVTPAIVVLFESESLERMGDQSDKHQMRMQCALFLRGDPWDSLADPVDQAMHQVLMTDAALRALVLDIRRVSVEAEAEEADRTAGTLAVTYLVTYLTKAADLSAQP